jgi:hypothetical protein
MGKTLPVPMQGRGRFSVFKSILLDRRVSRLTHRGETASVTPFLSLLFYETV